MTECGMRNAECGIVRMQHTKCGMRNGARFLIPHSAFRIPHSGVTLVELLITIAIIAILATAILGVASIATTTAREARTRNTITRLHTLLTEHYDTYKLRRVRLNTNVQNAVDATTNPRTRGQMQAVARLYALRELMLMEIPNRWSDVALADVRAMPVNGTAASPLYFAERTGLSTLYHRQLIRLLTAKNRLTGMTNTRDQILQNQSAECLYLFIMHATADGEARAQFGEKDIGDTDGDGALEFLDAWGAPIHFVRWAPAFESDAQLNYPRLNAMTLEQKQQAIAADRDPFDLFRVDETAFRLVPLIYSAGNDEELGIIGDENSSVPWFDGQTINLQTLRPVLSPYARTDGTTAYYQYRDYSLPIGVGYTDPADATDNIHNHLISTR